MRVGAAIMNRDYDLMDDWVDWVTFEDEEKCQSIIAELNPYIVRLGNNFCEINFWWSLKR